MILNNEQIRNVYGRVAPLYDAALTPYRLFGVDRSREQMVDALDLSEGETVVDLGCGTGANFRHLRERVGETGQIVGVDLSKDMLDQAEKYVRRNGWANVELVQGDVVEYRLPVEARCVCAAFAMEMVPDYDRLIAYLASALPAGGRLAVLGLKYPERWPAWLVRVAIALNKPFGVNPDYADQRPFRSIERHFGTQTYAEWLWGAVYLCTGQT